MNLRKKFKVSCVVCLDSVSRSKSFIPRTFPLHFSRFSSHHLRAIYLDLLSLLWLLLIWLLLLLWLCQIVSSFVVFFSFSLSLHFFLFVSLFSFLFARFHCPPPIVLSITVCNTFCCFPMSFSLIFIGFIFNFFSVFWILFLSGFHYSRNKRIYSLESCLSLSINRSLSFLLIGRIKTRGNGWPGWKGWILYQGNRLLISKND